MKKFWPLLFLTIACIPVLWALVKPGFYITHDGEFNLIRLMHFYKELSAGQFPVRWSFGLNYGFGSPLFTFFYPLTYYLGSIIHFFGPGFGTSLKILVGLTTVGSVLSMFTWLRGHFKPLASFFGAMFFLYAPYRLLVMYVTGSYGVLLALLFLPLIFLSIDKLLEKKRFFLPFLAILVFGLLISHNVTALILLPMTIVYAILLVLIRKVDKRIIIEIAAGFLLGLGLAAFFIIPALLETNLTFLSQGIVVNFRDHFPTLKQLIYSKWGYFYSVAGEGDGMSFQVGLAQWSVFTICFIFLLFGLLKGKRSNKNIGLVWFFTLMFLISIFMMLPWSDFIWEHVSPLPQIQFPWRILVASVAAVPFLGAYLVERRTGWMIAILLLALLFWGSRNNLRTWETIRYSDASYVARQSMFYGSTDIAGETRPVWVNVRPTWLSGNIVEDNPDQIIRSQTQEPNGNIVISVEASKSTGIVINRFYYPIWRVTIDDNETVYKPTDEKGLIRISISKGHHEVKVSYRKTNIEEVADIVSFSSLILLGYLFWTTSREYTK